MAELTERFRRLNESWNGLPRKLLLCAGALLACAALLSLLPVALPFAVGWLLSLALSPLVRLLTRPMGRVRLSRGAATAVGMLLLLALTGTVLGLAAARVVRELTGFVRTLPEWLGTVALPWVQGLLLENQDVLPQQVVALIKSAVASLGQQAAALAARLSGWLASGAVATATGLPTAVLTVVLTVMCLYYFTADRARIAAFFARQMPPQLLDYLARLRRDVKGALFGQVRSQMLVSLVLTVALALALAIYGVPYGLLVGLLIGAADALPVVGAGLFLVPWSIFAFLSGDVGMGVFVACVYLGTILLRQVLEPRIVGRNLGLYPLATMAAMYVGFRLMGLLGLLAGPILLSLCRVVLLVDGERRDGVSSL